jgi:hypothetical protein
MYLLCAQNLPNPYHEFSKSKYLFEEGNFIYDVVFPVHGEHLRGFKLTGISIGKLGKTIMNVENSPSTLLPRAAVSYTEVRIAQSQSRWKEDKASFP